MDNITDISAISCVLAFWGKCRWNRQSGLAPSRWRFRLSGAPTVEYLSTDLDLSVLGWTPEAMGKGNWKIGLVNRRACRTEQREAITAIASGREGGPMAGLTGLIGTFLGVESAPIRFDRNGATWAVKAAGLVDMEARAAMGINPAAPNHCTWTTQAVQPRIASRWPTPRIATCMPWVCPGTMQAGRTTDNTRLLHGRVLSSIPVKSLARRGQVLTLVCILVVAALAWAYLLYLERQITAGVDYEKAMAAMGMSVSQTWTLVDARLTFGMWIVMMIGMMAPAAAPVLLLFASMQATQGGPRKPSDATLLFALGYAAVWTGFSAGATALQWALHEDALLSAAMAVSGPYLSGAILIAAGLYQLTPWKSKCLSHCRSPLGFLMTNWRGESGAFRMGWDHGLFCLGCCWALMGVLFAVGVMNLVWVAALTGFVLLEKTGPKGAIIARAGGAGLVFFGLATITNLLSHSS